MGLAPVSDAETLRLVCEQTIDANPEAVRSSYFHSRSSLRFDSIRDTFVLIDVFPRAAARLPREAVGGAPVACASVLHACGSARAQRNARARLARATDARGTRGSAKAILK